MENEDLPDIKLKKSIEYIIRSKIFLFLSIITGSYSSIPCRHIYDDNMCRCFTSQLLPCAK